MDIFHIYNSSRLMQKMKVKLGKPVTVHCCSAVTTLCWFQCGVASAVYRLYLNSGLAEAW